MNILIGLEPFLHQLVVSTPIAFINYCCDTACILSILLPRTATGTSFSSYIYRIVCNYCLLYQNLLLSAESTINIIPSIPEIFFTLQFAISNTVNFTFQTVICQLYGGLSGRVEYLSLITPSYKQQRRQVFPELSSPKRTIFAFLFTKPHLWSVDFTQLYAHMLSNKL